MNTAQQAAFSFLNGHKVGVLSTASNDGKVWGAAIYYVVDEQLSFYFLTHLESKKYHNLQQHSQAAMTVADDYQQSTVQASGKVTEVPESEEYDTALRKLALVHPTGQFSWVPPVSKIHDKGGTALMKFTPESLQHANYKPDSPQDNLITQVL